MSIKLNLIAAACENLGIGKNNNLPWRLKSEMAYFTKMTSTTKDASKKNVVIMGRRTWDSIPPKFKPLDNRINFVLSRSDLNLEGYTNCYSFKSLDDVIKKLEDAEFKEKYEDVWVVGGSFIYKETMHSKHFYRLYLTRILENFECDTFFPPLGDHLESISLPHVPQETQEENGIKFEYKVYQNKHFKEDM